MGKKTKIDWCDASWNPLTGCLHGCEYCYAQGIANRFKMQEADMTDSCSANMESFEVIKSPRTGDALCVLHEPYKTIKIQEPSAGAWEKTEPYPVGFIPTFHTYRLGLPIIWRTPRNIFVCSMADLFGDWVPDEWIEDVFRTCQVAPQHRYLFLTKNPKRYFELAEKGKLVDQANFWYGTSITAPDQKFFYETPFFRNKERIHSYGIFLSIEPILANFTPVASFRREDGQQNCIDWIICGAETGNRKGKVKPERAWIENLMKTSCLTGVPLFMKESLRGIMGDDFRQDFPWEEGAETP